MSGADAFLQICGHRVDLLRNGVFHTTFIPSDFEGASLVFTDPVNGNPPSLTCWGDIYFALLWLGQLDLMQRVTDPLRINHTPFISTLRFPELL